MSAPPALSTLADIPTLLDLTCIKYNVGHVKVAPPAAAKVTYHAGTNLPKRISGLGKLAAGTLVYKQTWYCCGDYGCSSGNGNRSARRCLAAAVLKIESTGVEDEFRVSFDEPDAGDHGDEYVAPTDDAAPRTLYRTKVAMAEAAARGLSYDDMVNGLPAHLRPVGARSIKAFRRRYENQTKPPVAKAKKKRSAAAAAAPSARKKVRRSAAEAVPESGATKSDDEDDADDDDKEAAQLLANINNNDDDDDDDDHSNDIDFAAALMARREAVPWQELCSVDAAAAKLAPLDDIEQRLAALDVVDPMAADDESDESDSVAIVSARVHTTAMFVSELVDPLLADPTCADARQRYLARVQAPLADRFARSALIRNSSTGARRATRKPSWCQRHGTRAAS